MIINKSSMERGFGHGTLHKTVRRAPRPGVPACAHTWSLM